jgi:hypothetical protein
MGKGAKVGGAAAWVPAVAAGAIGNHLQSSILLGGKPLIKYLQFFTRLPI